MIVTPGWYDATPIRLYVREHNPSMPWMAKKLRISRRTLFRITAGQARVKSKAWKAFLRIVESDDPIPKAEGSRVTLTFKDARRIRKAYPGTKKKPVTMAELAERYGVHPATISAVITNRTWRSA